MTRVGELLVSVAESAPVQRVRNYYLTDRESSPRPRDFLTAMKRSGGEICVRWAGPPGVCASNPNAVLENRIFSGCDESPIRNSSSELVSDGDCFVRYGDPGWECAKHDRIRGRRTVERLDPTTVREWLRDSDPELVAYESVRGAFEDACVGEVEATATGANRAVADGGTAGDATTRVRVERDADLREDPGLDSRDAAALARAFPVAPGRVVFRLPLVLAEESVLESVEGSDRVFVAERVPERETECAHYVRQARRGCWVPKGETTVYELAEGATVGREPVGPRECGDADDSPESV